jgi:AraC-like DNA-binding protein
MPYNEIKPGKELRAYIKCYYIYRSETDLSFEDTVFPSGCVEIIFNLGTGKWQTSPEDHFVNTPSIELWGQITRPLTVRSNGKNTMLGIRFYTHAAAFFLNDKIDLFNDKVADFGDVSGNTATRLHAKLLDTPAWDKKIALVESYLIGKLSQSQKSAGKIALINEIMHELQAKDFFDNIENVATRYGITSRYLQKLFLQYTGLTPKLYSKINRFQNSLTLVTKKDISLTAVAYTCGYFDQSHFIREFKSFTGLTPSSYSITNSPVTFALANN